MSTPTKPSFLQALLASGLLDAEQQKELRSLPEAKEDNPNNLAKAVLHRGWMTRYQLSQIANGKAKGLTLGQYTIMERLGEGGMGQVLKAKHRRMNRFVALKIIRKEKLADATSVKRFYKEVEAAAQLTHPNIVLAFNADEVGETHYMAMEYVEGCDLAQLVSESGPLSERQACDFIRQAALGLQHAHERGMVHRDIKPHNLLVTQAKNDDKKGDEDPEAVVKILGMGLAKIQTGDGREQGLTQTGEVIGTPDYLAPEQAVNSKSADIRSDLYALGCTFYFLLTGKPPFYADSMAEVLLKHQMEKVPALENTRTDVSNEVVAILEKLLAKKAEDRYQTPAELLQVLDPLCKGEKPAAPIALALPPAKVPDSPSMDGFWEDDEEPTSTRQRRGNSRTQANSRTTGSSPRKRPRSRKAKPSNKKWILIGTSVGGVVLVLVLALVAVLVLKEDAPADTAEQRAERTNTDSTKPTKTDRGSTDSKDKGPDTLVTQDFTKDGKPKPTPTPPPPPPPATREKYIDELYRVEGFTGDVRSLEFSQDGTHALIMDVNGVVRVWQVQPRKHLAVLRLSRFKTIKATFSPDNRTVASIGSDGTITFWSVATGRPVTELARLPRGPRHLTFSPDGKRLGVIEGRGTFSVYNVSFRKEMFQAEGHPKMIHDIAFSPDGTTIATSSVDKTVRLWDARNGKLLRTLEGHASYVSRVEFSADSKRLFSNANYGGDHIVWDAATGAVLHKLALRRASWSCFIGDGRYVLIGGPSDTGRVWDVETGQVDRLMRDRQYTWTCTASRDGRYALRGGKDIVSVWQLPAEYWLNRGGPDKQ